MRQKLIPLWNTNRLTAPQREQVRRAAVLLGIPLPQPEASQEQPDEQAENDYTVKNLALDTIFIDKARFQPRDDFSEDKVQEIVQNFNPALFKPLIVWTDPKNSKTYVLAGHHRYEALKRMGRTSAPVVFAEGDEQKAVEIAWTENQSGRSQTALENAKYLRLLAKSGRTKTEIERECRSKYERSCTIALDLSHLNPHGKALVDLSLLRRESETYKDQETMCQWIGKLRARYPDLTNSHENEVYDWLRENYKIKGRKMTNSASFLSYMDDVIAKRTAFGKIDERLNITIVPKSAVAAEYDEQIARAERELQEALEKLNDEREEAMRRELKGEITPAQRIRGLQRYEDAVTIAQREVLRLNEAKGRGVKAAKESEISLFGMGSVETSIMHLVSIALSHKEGGQWQSLGEITDIQKQDIKQATGINVQDYSEHILDESNIRHAWKRHTNATIEENRNQIPLTEADFALIPFVLQEYDSIRAGLSGKLHTIEYHKRINGYIIVVEEVRTKRKKLAFKTMYKKKASQVQPAMPENTFFDRAAQTPEAYRAYLENKNTTSSLQNQVLSDSSVAQVKAMLLAKWNDSTLTAEKREQVRRAAVLLSIELPPASAPTPSLVLESPEAARFPHRVVRHADGTFFFSSGYNADLVNALKQTFTQRTWDANRKAWLVFVRGNSPENKEVLFTIAVHPRVCGK